MIILFGSDKEIGKEFKTKLELLKIPCFCWPTSDKTTFYELEDWYEDSNYPLIGGVINANEYIPDKNVKDQSSLTELTINNNILFPQILTNWCMLNDIPLGHISNTCIYTGTKDDQSLFTENDDPNFTFKENADLYSSTKALSEKIVLKWNKSYIWRSGVLFDDLTDIKDNLKDKISFSNKHEFVNACIKILNSDKINYGIYNIVNIGNVDNKKILDVGIEMKKL